MQKASQLVLLKGPLTKGPYEFELTALRQTVLDILSPATHCQKTSSLRAETRQTSRAWGPSAPLRGECWPLACGFSP
jgi:hypothetical protein